VTKSAKFALKKCPILGIPTWKSFHWAVSWAFPYPKMVRMLAIYICTNEKYLILFIFIFYESLFEWYSMRAFVPQQEIKMTILDKNKLKVPSRYILLKYFFIFHQFYPLSIRRCDKKCYHLPIFGFFMIWQILVNFSEKITQFWKKLHSQYTSFWDLGQFFSIDKYIWLTEKNCPSSSSLIEFKSNFFVVYT